jgi:hypothetical protein
MKLKTLWYMASFLAFAGINAAENPAHTVVDITVHHPAPAAEEVLPQRTAAQVLQELTSLTMTDALQRGFFRRAGDHISTAGVYVKHVVKYPVVVGALWLPLVMKSKNEIFDSSIGRSINWVIYGSLGAAAAIGLYRGPSEARQQLKTEAIVAEHPHTQAMLNTATARVADLENLHGVLGRVQADVTRLTQQGEASRRALTALQTQAQQAETHLNQLRTESTAAQAKLTELQAAGAASTALAQIDGIQGSISRHGQLVQLLAQLMDSRTHATVRAALLASAQGMLIADRLCESARAGILSQVRGNSSFINAEQQLVIERLKTDLAPVLENQQALQVQATQFLGTIQLQIQQEEQVVQAQRENQTRLALEAAATRVEVPVVPAVSTSGGAVPRPSLSLRNGFGGMPGFPLMRQPQLDVESPITEVTEEVD